MKFLVFIKQVPDVAEIRFDPERKTIIREGVKNVINPYDRRAISEAIRYRNERGGVVVVATMGPPQARDALLESLIMGADRAVHILDGSLAGSDTLATARVLAAAAKKIGFDLILCGQHSTDAETAQVPAELAELLEIPCAVSVRKIDYQNGRIRASCETDEGTDILDLPIPCVLSAAERLIKPIKVKEIPLSSAPAERIEVLTLSDLRLSADRVGLGGSPTWVAAVYEQETSRKTEILNGSDPREAAAKILEAVQKQEKQMELPAIPQSSNHGDAQFWCLVEYYQDQIRPVSLEMLAAAAALVSKKGGTVCAILIGAGVSTQEMLLLSSYGADKIYQTTATQPHPDEVVTLLCDRILALKPFAFLLPATPRGKYLAPRIAARLQLGLTGDCVGLQIDDHGNLAQLKPAFGGTIVAPIYSKTDPQMATVRPGALAPYRPRAAAKIPVIAWTFPFGIQRKFQIVAQEVDSGKDAEKLEHAQIVVCVGMGLGKENVPLAFQLADLLNGAVGATRRVVDSGWMPRQYQIGLTGKFIAPRAYIGLGVSGRYNHTIGIRKSNTVVVVNSDPAAEIFRVADLGIVGDCVEVTRLMIEACKKRQISTETRKTQNPKFP